MGATSSKSDTIPSSKDSFLIDRTLAAECDFLPETVEQVIRIGVFTGSTDKPNPLRQQGLRIGDGPIHTLKHCVEHTNGLEYQFEKDVTLSVFKREGAACYRLKTDALDVTRTIHPFLAKNFKTIGMREASAEVDKLVTVMR
jgi:hypothetical protein